MQGYTPSIEPARPSDVNILIVDDRADGLLALEAVLSEPGYNIVKASSGQEAVAQLFDRTYAVILMDVQMPGMDGFETARVIKQLNPSKDTPIIFITAINKDSAYISRGYESGAVDYIFKPFDPFMLLSKVRVFVELHRKTQVVKEQGELLLKYQTERSKQELQRAADELERSNDQLRQSNQDLGQFAFIAAHDLKEPLRKITMFIERLNEQTDNLTDKQKDYFGRVQSAGKRMMMVIEDLLQYFRIAPGEVAFEDIDLKFVLQETVSDLEVLISDYGARIEIGEEFPQVRGNRSQMRHLFQNLITNAIKFGKKDVAPVIRIRGAVSADGRLAEISVADNGIGLDEKYAEKIFQPFQRLHSKSEYEGTGIGLSIAQKIVQNHGGSIRVKSSPGKGATFTVSFPVVNAVVQHA
jgi:signal transduction histidine kinase